MAYMKHQIIITELKKDKNIQVKKSIEEIVTNVKQNPLK